MGAISFYENFLQMTNRYLNPLSSGVLSFSDFLQSNFLVVINFEKLKIEEGTIQLRLKFDAILSEKLVLLWSPIVEKKLIVSKDLDVVIE